MHLRFVLPSIAFLLLGAACSVGTNDGDADLIGADGSTPDTGTRAFRDSGTRDAGPPGDAGGGCLTEELCENGLDDDCDGIVEEECACIPGQTARCFGGVAAQRGVGACMDGMMECTDGLEFGTWGPCEGDVVPSDEVCDTAGVDESCNGAANEGCACIPGETSACGSDVGACSPGTQTCDDGMLGACQGSVAPLAEVCNGADDDCDGTTDEGISRACGTDVGACSRGTERCVAGAFEACVGGVRSTPELCDGVDNDCDGNTDEGLTRGCGSAVGACVAGTQTCTAAAWGTCSGETLPAVESCNAVDDDCDGRTDEGVSRACGSSTGICTPGTQTCAAGAFGACTGGTPPGTEVCDGARDENCDGTVDEGCGCTTGNTRPCGTNVGQCSAGSQTCDASGNWAACMGAVGPQPEVCNGLDDDCDGSADEGGICPTTPPVVSCPGSISAGVLSTVSLSGSGSDPDGGAVTFRWTVTSRPVGSASNPSAPNSSSTNFYLDASGNYTLQLCVTDDEGEMACCSTSVTSVPPGALHVEVSWSTVYGDVDSHLLNVTRTDPTGWFTVDDCYWGNRAPDWGPVGAAANPTLDIDDTNGLGPENTTINNMPAAGTYAVGLHYYCSHSIGAGATPGDGPTSATVRVYCDGALIATYTGLTLNRTDDWRTVAEVDYPSCVGRSRNRQTTGNEILPASFTAPRHCEIPCTSNADCTLPREFCRSVVGPGGRRNICYF